MRRREFVRGLGISAVLPVVSRAQQTTPTIGFLSTRAPDEAAVHTNAFRRGLVEMGYVEGRSVVVEYRWAKGDYSQLSSFVADLLSRPLSLVVTAGDPAAQVAKAAGFGVPLVFVVGQDPVRSGLVARMNRPGMATGVNFCTGDLGGKRLQLLCEMVPSAHLVGLLLNPRFGIEAAEQHRQAVASAAQTLGRELVVQESGNGCRDRREFWRASQGWCRRPDRAERSVLRQPAQSNPDTLVPSSAARYFPHPGVSGGWRAHELWCQPV